MTVNAQHKVQEIFQKSGGQSKVTETAIRTLIARDHTFLLGLVEPYLHGIIAHAIERARKEPVKKAPPVMPQQPLPKKIVKAKTLKPVKNDALGNILDTMAQKFSDSQTSKKPAQASKAHVSTMQALAKNQFGKKKD